MRELKAVKFRGFVTGLQDKAHPRGREDPITTLEVTDIEGLDQEVRHFLRALVYPPSDQVIAPPAVVTVTIEYEPPKGMPKIERKVGASIRTRGE